MDLNNNIDNTKIKMSILQEYENGPIVKILRFFHNNVDRYAVLLDM